MAEEPIDPGKGLVPLPRDPQPGVEVEPGEAFVPGATYFHPMPTRKADPATFQVLNALYAKDAKMVYYRYGKVPKADPATFRVLDPGFFRETPEYSLDFPESHGQPHFQGYARDHQNVFHYVDTIGQPSPIRGVDLETFEILQWGFARDRDHVYHERTRLKGVKPDDFRQLSKYFSVTSKAVYCLSNKIEGAGPGSFRILRDALALDRNRVYLHERVIEGADPGTYEAVGWSAVGKDRNRVFLHWEPLEGADPETFVAVGGGYQKDIHRVYYLGHPVPKADPKTIRCVRHNWAEDDRGCYRSGYPQKKPSSFSNPGSTPSSEGST